MPTLALMNPTPPIMNIPLNLWIWCRTKAPSLIIKLTRIKIFKTDIRKLSILSKIWKWRILQGVGGHLVCVIMTHCVRKSVCDSPLKCSFPGQFLGKPNADIIEFSCWNFFLQLKNQKSRSKTVWFFHYSYFKRNYDVLKSKSSYFLLNKNIKFNKN